MNNSIPILPKRPNNLDKFSTYMILLDTQNGRTEIRWESQPRLRRYLELCAQNDPEFAGLLYQQDRENELALFLMDIAVNNSQPPADWEPEKRKLLAWQCVAAYLQEQCYWAAREVWEENREGPWEEYLYIAQVFIYDEDKLLDVLAKSYKHDHTKLNIYVRHVLLRNIKNEVAVVKVSDWRLLSQNSNNYLNEALSLAGYQEPQISYLIFVRKIFKEVYVLNKIKDRARKRGDKWPEPDDEDFSQTATLCNADKSFWASHEVAVGLPTLDGQQVKEWLKICIQALRSYPNSINPQYSLEALQQQYIEPIAENSAISSIEELSSTGETNRMQQADGAFREEMKVIQARVETGVQNNILQESYRKMPVLYYGVGLTHTQLAEIFGVNQSNITRHLLKYYEKPLMDCLAGFKQSDEWVKSYVLEWLKKHYGSPLYSDLIQGALVEAIAKLESKHQEVLRLRYVEKMNSQEIARQQGMIESEVDQRIDEAQQGLENALVKAIGRWRKAIVKSWLENFYLQEIELVVQSTFSDGSTPTAEMLRDFLLRWIRSTMNISLDSQYEVAKIDKLVIKLLQSRNQKD